MRSTTNHPLHAYHRRLGCWALGRGSWGWRAGCRAAHITKQCKQPTQQLRDLSHSLGLEAPTGCHADLVTYLSLQVANTRSWCHFLTGVKWGRAIIGRTKFLYFFFFFILRLSRKARATKINQINRLELAQVYRLTPLRACAGYLLKYSENTFHESKTSLRIFKAMHDNYMTTYSM